MNRKKVAKGGTVCWVCKIDKDIVVQSGKKREEKDTSSCKERNNTD
jgi:hypothetical protein